MTAVSLSRAHFRLIAGAFYMSKPRETNQVQRLAQWQIDVDMICEALATTNLVFDREKFHRWCHTGGA